MNTFFRVAAKQTLKASRIHRTAPGITAPLRSGPVILFASALCAFGQLFPSQNGNNLPTTNSLFPIPDSGILLIDYNFFSIPDTLDVYLDNLNIFSSGPVAGEGEFTIPFGPGASSLSVVMNQEGNPSPADLWQYTPSIVPEPGPFALALLASSLILARRRTLTSR